jgi:glycosyltransferase involved in cell wall biosynthesis
MAGGVWAVTMVKNEQDVIGFVIPHLFAQGIEGVIVADNLSTDRTRSILDDLAAQYPVTVLDDNEVAHFQSKKVTRLVHMARECGASWVVPFDADELWVSPQGRLADVMMASDDADVLVGAWLDHYRVPCLRGSPFAKMPLRARNPSGYKKVAVRPLAGLRIQHGNHEAYGVESLRVVSDRIVVHHYRYRSFRHFVAKSRKGKAALDAAGDAIPAGIGAHWRHHGDRSVPRLALSWLEIYRHAIGQGVVLDRVVPSEPFPPESFPSEISG